MNTFEVCKMSIDGPDSRLSTAGKILKLAWMIGPSKAVLSKGKVLENDVKSDTDQQDADKQQDNATASKNDTGDKDTDSESFIRSYSILEAFTNIHLAYEDTSDKESGEDDDRVKSEIGKFESGTTYNFKVSLEPEGYTEWVVAIDKRADIEAVKNAIRAKKFKAAYQIASKDTESDGLVPLSATTYINKKPPIYPAFIGHCRYGFDSGSIDGPEDNLTICLAIAPINARTNKPSEDTVIKAVYNVVGDITGGVLGNLAATITQKVRDAADGKSSRYDRDYDDNGDKDSEKNKSEELSKFLNKKFRCVGDHTMYNEFLSIRKFIKSHLGDNTLELKSVTVGNDSSSKPLSAAACKEVYKNKLVYF